MLDRLTIERMERVADGGPILVALSGGGDSTALLLLLAERFGEKQLHAAIVDHALRAGSADEAKRAADFAEGQGVRAEVLKLSWSADQTRSQQAARDARYRALCDVARRLAARVVALGHNADDQAETVVMRAAAGSSWRGLAGIAPLAPAPIWPEGRGLVLARPLLGARRRELRALLSQRGVGWVDDPSNENVNYERVRIRQRLAELEQLRFDTTGLARLAERMRAIADRVDAAAGALIERAAVCEEDLICIERRAWRGDASVRERALSVLICAASGEQRAPAPEAVTRLEERMRAPDFRGATLGGAALSMRRDRIVISRDAGAVSGRAGGVEAAAPLHLLAGQPTIWDGRIALTASTPGVVVYADGSKPRMERPNNATVEARWLLAERVAHLLAAARLGADPQSPANEINIPKR